MDQVKAVVTDGDFLTVDIDLFFNNLSFKLISIAWSEREKANNHSMEHNTKSPNVYFRCSLSVAF